MASGAIVLADISGYTAFVTTTELEHSHAILAELLEVMTRGATGRLQVAQLEGDAIFWLGGAINDDLVELLRTLFIAFHRRVRDMAAVNSCPCRACTSVTELSLKFIVHSGPYVRQQVGGHDHFVGAENVVAHRLLKNSVPSREYLLLTDAALSQLPEQTLGPAVRGEDSYDLGRVGYAYLDLAPLRSVARTYERTRVAPEEAHLRDVAVFGATREAVWGWFAADPHRLALLAHPVWHDVGVTGVDSFMGARGDLLGGEVHCHHGPEGRKLTVVRVVERRPVDEATLLVTGYGPDHWVTERFEPRGEAQTRVEVLMWWEGGTPPDLDHFRERLAAELERVGAKVGEALA